MDLPFKNSSFLFIIIVIISSYCSSSSLPRLPDVSYSSGFPTIDETYTNSGAGIPLGWWELLQRSIGISAMHMQLLYTDKIVIFDRTDFGNSNLSLPAGRNCIRRDQDPITFDCTSHSVLYDVASNTFRPLTVLTDTFCSSGSVDPSGNLIQTGGYNFGERVIRTFTPCSPAVADTCDWEEHGTSLAARRWYASNAVLPDGRIIVVGGRGTHSYEFFPKNNSLNKKYETFFKMRFLAETWDGRNRENNLYPFLHLLPNGNLFIFANNRSIEFDYNAGKVVREFPVMPSPERRNYPSTGSSVLLPILLNSSSPEVEVLICGGATPESFYLADSYNVYVEASRKCGRMKLTTPQPRWIMEEMPMPRVMPDMVILPTGDILIVNGAANGTAGWENAENPVLHPILYRTSDPDPARRFVVLNPTRIPRMYHSCAVLAADGRVIVGGSNPHPNYNFSREAKYPTELSLEAFYPPYLDPTYSELRPSILSVEIESNVVTYGQDVSVTYALGGERKGEVAVTWIMPPFATHSFGMNQRMLVLEGARVERLSVFGYKVTARAPENEKLAPPGYYMLFVVHSGVPSHGVWVHLRRSLI